MTAYRYARDHGYDVDSAVCFESWIADEGYDAEMRLNPGVYLPMLMMVFEDGAE